MTRIALQLLAAALLLSCDAAAAPQAAQLPATAEEAPPQMTNVRFQREAVHRDLATTLARLGAADRDPFWVAYHVPIVEDHPYTCCWTEDWKPGPCRLEARSQSWGSSDRDRERAAGSNLMALLRLAGGEVGKVRAVSQGCALDLGGRRLVWLEDVDAEDSIRTLARLARAGGGRKGEDPGEEAVMAISLHGLPQADAALEELATGGHAGDIREAALFWLGQTRGRRGYEILSRFVREEQDGELREKAVFSLSQSEVPEAADRIVEVARGDRSPEVRGQALFWLSQGRHKRPDAILEAVSHDPDSEVREEAVFALSQLPDGKGTEMLVQVVRESRDPEIREKALFWLGQSKDPRAMEFLSELLAE
ncbi:MAG: HEAT repeat domain-containing protein [Thermoanaerobaculia bacterium]